MGLRYAQTTATTSNQSMYVGDGTINTVCLNDKIIITHNNAKYIITPDVENNGLIIKTDENSRYFQGGFGGQTTEIAGDPTEGDLYKRFSTLPFITKSHHKYTLTDSQFAYGGETEDSLSLYFKPLIQTLCKDNHITYKDFNNLGCELQYLTSPLARFFNIPGESRFADCGYSDDSVMLCKDLNSVCVSVFGISQPKLRKLSMQKLFSFQKDTNGGFIDFKVNDGWIGMAECLTEAFGVDLAYNILSETNASLYDRPYSNYRTVYSEFFKALGYKYTKKLMKSQKDKEIGNSNGMIYLMSDFNDVVWQWEKYREGKLPERLVNKGFCPLTLPHKCKTFKELHDRVSIEYNKIKMVDEFKYLNYKKLKTHGILKQLHKVKYGEYTIVLPESTATLVHWGQEVKNCIASYFDRVETDKLMVLALVKDNKIIYNIEIVHRVLPIIGSDNKMKSDFMIKQYHGFKNEKVKYSEEVKFSKFINTKIRI